MLSQQQQRCLSVSLHLTLFGFICVFYSKLSVPTQCLKYNGIRWLSGVLKIHVTNESWGSLSRKRDSRAENTPHSDVRRFIPRLFPHPPLAHPVRVYFGGLVHNREHCVSLKRTRGTSGVRDSPGFLERHTGGVVITGPLA